MKLIIDTNVAAIRAQLARIEKKDVPFALRKAVTNTAFGIRDAIEKDMPRSLDRPTPYTMRSTLVQKPGSTGLFAKDEAVASIFIKNDSPKGTAPADYLKPEVFGGVRKVKRAESLLRQRGILSPSSFIVPASGVKLDRYGNIPRGTMAKLLASLGATSGRAEGPTQYFVVNKPHSTLPEGVWAKTRNKLKPVLLFVNEPYYRERFDFFGVAEKIGSDLLPIELRKVVEWILKHPRP